jgi:hypothetical protein
MPDGPATRIQRRTAAARVAQFARSGRHDQPEDALTPDVLAPYRGCKLGYSPTLLGTVGLFRVAA